MVLHQWHSDDSSSSDSGGSGGGASASIGEGSCEDLVVEEPDDVFEARMEEALKWLEARPEQSIAIVSHWGGQGGSLGGMERT